MMQREADWSGDRDRSLTPLEAAALLGKMSSLAQEQLAKNGLFTEAEIDRMGQPERIMRWVLFAREKLDRRVRCAFELPPQQAMTVLQTVDEEIERLMNRTGSPAHPFLGFGPALFKATRSFDRRVKLLQAYESIRDFAASHGGRLPESLDECELFVPLDPMTGKPFQYAKNAKSAVLTWSAKIDGMPMRSYEIKITN